MTEANHQPTMRRDVLAVAIAAVVAVVLGVNLFLLFDDPDEELVGESAPAFELPVKDSEEMKALADYEGRVVLIDFWASWCPPCLEQVPILERIAEDPELDERVEVLSVNTDIPGEDRHQKIEEFVEEVDKQLPTLLDDGDVRAAYRVGIIPTLVVVDPDGRIDAIKEGPCDESCLRDLVEQAGAPGG